MWADAKTVNVAAAACFSTHAGILRTALQFFVGTWEHEGEEADSDDSDDDAAPLQMVTPICNFFTPFELFHEA